MKRSFNFYAPRRYALTALLRAAHTRSWEGEPISPATKKRLDEDLEYLAAQGVPTQTLAALQVTEGCVTSNGKNLAEVLYSAFDSGWRTDGKGWFISPEGKGMKSPRVMWYDALLSIERANVIKTQKLEHPF